MASLVAPPYFYFTLFNFCIVCSVVLWQIVANKYDDDDVIYRYVLCQVLKPTAETDNVLSFSDDDDDDEVEDDDDVDAEGKSVCICLI